MIQKYWTPISAFFDIRSRFALTQPRTFLNTHGRENLYLLCLSGLTYSVEIVWYFTFNIDRECIFNGQIFHRNTLNSCDWYCNFIHNSLRQCYQSNCMDGCNWYHKQTTVRAYLLAFCYWQPIDMGELRSNKCL